MWATVKFVEKLGPPIARPKYAVARLPADMKTTDIRPGMRFPAQGFFLEDYATRPLETTGALFVPSGLAEKVNADLVKLLGKASKDIKVLKLKLAAAEERAAAAEKLASETEARFRQERSNRMRAEQKVTKLERESYEREKELREMRWEKEESERVIRVLMADMM